MSLMDVNFKEEYRTGETDLVEDFYGPCLRNSVKYDRAVGYFRSSIFILVGPDLIDFAKKGGKVRLICSPVMTHDDNEAIRKGYESKAERAAIAIERDIGDLFNNKLIAKNTEALATLITLGVIDLKLAFLPESQGIYHEKIGLFYDKDEQCISFKGSINETWNGWHERGNYESFDAFCNWLGGRDERQVNRNKNYFEELWNGPVGDIDIVEFPKVARDKLRLVSKDSIDEIDPVGLVDYFSIGTNISRLSVKEDSCEYANKRTPLPHQLAAITAWKKQNRRGILKHATGSGKTFTAITALKEHLTYDGVAIVLVPDRLLHQQWGKELKDEIENLGLLKAGDGHNIWRKADRLREFTSLGKGFGKRIVLATMPTARMPEFINNVSGGEHLMVVADEVHEIGSKKNSNALKINSGPRLGLSATPERYNDSVGTAKIINYFGEIIQPPYTLEDAISDNRLVPYEYYPGIVRFTADESEEWAKATEEISKEYAKLKRGEDGKAIISNKLQNMLIQRSRIAKKAQAKTALAVNIIKDNYKEGESWLIYCEDQFQLREVMDELKASGYSPAEYHTNMVGDSMASLDWFKNFGGIMLSIRCLDQGVDIPKISHAIILASSQNPRQFIQRRGRVLRICDDKYKAVIFDAVVAPISLELEPQQISLLKSEFIRSIQFAKTALNKSSANELVRIAIDLGIDPDEVGLYDSDGIEETEYDQ